MQWRTHVRLTTNRLLVWTVSSNHLDV